MECIKASAGLELMSYRFIVNALTNYAMLLRKEFRKENIYKTMILLFISFESTSLYGSVTYHLHL